jgi:glycosyltransferase involved in cell wall biosynthesis
MKIGVDILPLLANRTGIANYQFYIMKHIEQTNPDLSFEKYQKFTWSCRDIVHFDGAKQPQASKPVSAGLLRLVKNSSSTRSLARKLRDLCFQASKIDINFFHAFNYRPPNLRTFPFLPVIYDLSHKRHPELHPVERVKWLDEMDPMLSSFPLIQTVSMSSALEISRFYNVDINKIRVIYPGVEKRYRLSRQLSDDGVADDQAVLSRFGLKSAGYFLSACTLEPRKNLQTIISAYNALPYPIQLRCPLVLTGGKGWGEELKCTNPNILFTGYVSDDELATLYRECLCFVNASLYEGFGMPVVEALASGAQVLVSDIPVFREVAGELVGYVDALDVDGWRAAMAGAVELNKRPTPTSEIITSYSWESAAEHQVKVYVEFDRLCR